MYIHRCLHTKALVVFMYTYVVISIYIFMYIYNPFIHLIMLDACIQKSTYIWMYTYIYIYVYAYVCISDLLD